MDDFRIDSHKLMYHVSRVNQWLNGENIYPIYLEIGPSGACNHRCTFCALDYLGYKPQFIEKSILKNFLSEAARCGVKSVMYAGEGEPLLHKEIGELILYTKKIGIDVSITTNGVFLNSKIVNECLGSLTWMRISLDAATSQTYARIHRCKPQDFDCVLENLDYAVKIKRQNNYLCTIGVQMLLLPENVKEVTILASVLKDRGVDYLVIKPFSPHLKSSSNIYKNFDYRDYLYLADELGQLSSKDFKIIFRFHTMKKLSEKKTYESCLGLPFFANIASNGDIYTCHTFIGNDKFCYGNIYKNSFSEIWESSRRKNVLNSVIKNLDVTQCRQSCRLDEINRYLWELKHPSAHVNFI